MVWRSHKINHKSNIINLLVSNHCNTESGKSDKWLLLLGLVKVLYCELDNGLFLPELCTHFLALLNLQGRN